MINSRSNSICGIQIPYDLLGWSDFLVGFLLYAFYAQKVASKVSCWEEDS